MAFASISPKVPSSLSPPPNPHERPNLLPPEKSRGFWAGTEFSEQIVAYKSTSLTLMCKQINITLKEIKSKLFLC